MKTSRRSFLKTVGAIPAAILGFKLAVGNETPTYAKAATQASIRFTNSDKVFDYVAIHSPAAVRVRQDMNDGSMVWTILEIDLEKELPNTGHTWTTRHGIARFNLSQIDQKQGLMHTFWIKEIAPQTLTDCVPSIMGTRARIFVREVDDQDKIILGGRNLVWYANYEWAKDGVGMILEFTSESDGGAWRGMVTKVTEIK